MLKDDVFVGDISPQRATAGGHLSKGIRRGMELRCKTLDSYPSNKIQKQKQTNKQTVGVGGEGSVAENNYF